MSKLSDELALQLEDVIRERTDRYSSREQAREWITIDFAEWLVTKFAKERYNV